MFIVQLCNLVFVDLIQGINKILSAISIPYPLGESAVPKEEQYELISLHLFTNDLNLPYLKRNNMN